MEIVDGNKTACVRCDTLVPLDKVAVLEQPNNKSMEKPLCGDCLKVIGVPRGYTVERDVSYLARDDPSDEA